jgi:predicted RecB family nuclease
VSAQASAVLGGYPAKQCARAVHNDYSPASPPKPVVDQATQKLFDAGNEFEAKVNERLGQAPGSVVLSDAAGWNANIAATLVAMRERVPMIVNGRLPRAGTMAGAPDVLVRIGDGYVPVDVKLHGTRKDAVRTGLWVSSLTEPSERRRVKGLSDAGWSVEGDGFQLAHYTRMLQHLGFHAGDEYLIGGIIGQSDYDDLGGDPWLIVWYDLGTPRRDTYSASAETGRAKRSLLERYDHEFAFRLQVADAARAGGELVRPFHTSDCGWCVWQSYCRETAGPDDASFAIQAGLPSAQQWRYLYDAGATTVAELAALDPDRSPEGWSPRDNQPGSRAERKYATLVRRARMAQAGIEIEPLDQWPQTPSADVEVDFDIEWDFENRIYLWGLRVRQGQDDTTAVFNPTVSYEPLDDASEAALAAQFADQLRIVITDAETAGRTVRIFHWSDPERSRTRKYPEIDELLEGRAFDLLAWFNNHFLTLKGGSLKAVAPIFGFEWTVEDAGGAQSQVKVDLARTGGDEGRAATEWLHHYNESDVAAQAAIRDGLRSARYTPTTDRINPQD